ncbi:hypothetical protein B0H14DRAFT_3476276 [Mycena olivaceomarginata]|nr:hypothetical protein B0H14DRAFT_3476276 [Mycena olivaceomarginata]
MAILSKILLALIAASVVVGQSPPWGQCGMDRTHYVHSWMDLRIFKSFLFPMLARHRDHHSDPRLPPATTSTPPATTSTPPATTTTTATPPTGSNPSQGVIGTDFEGTVDSSVWSVIATAQSGGSATIDTTKAHSGTHSLKIVSTGGFSNHVFYGLSNLNALRSGSDIYGRYYAPCAWVDNSAFWTGNRASDDSIMPDGSPTSNAGSIAIAGNTWYCIEFHLSRTTGQIQTWVNGNATLSLTTPANTLGILIHT